MTNPSAQKRIDQQAIEYENKPKGAAQIKFDFILNSIPDATDPVEKSALKDEDASKYTRNGIDGGEEKDVIYNPCPEPEKCQDVGNQLARIGFLPKCEHDGDECKQIEEDLGWPNCFVVLTEDVEKLIDSKREVHRDIVLVNICQRHTRFNQLDLSEGIE